MLSPARTPPTASPHHSSPSTPNTPRKPSPLPRTRVPAPPLKKEESLEEYIDPKVFVEDRMRVLEVSYIECGRPAEPQTLGTIYMSLLASVLKRKIVWL